MGDRVTLLAEAPRKLEIDERLELAESIMASVQRDTSAEFDAAWLAEARDRLAAWRRGDLQSVSAHEALCKHLTP